MSHTQLTLTERHVIYHLRLVGRSCRAIARQLRRDHSTISRELRRNAPPANHAYIGAAAHHKAALRRLKPKHRRRIGHVPLEVYVREGLHHHWSPEQIAGRLIIDFPDDPAMRLALETIYGWVYQDAKAHGSLWRNLRHQHPKRRRQSRFGKGRCRIPGRVSIDQRPEIVATRTRFGDWEGDTVMGAQGHGAIVTLVERKSRYLLVGQLKDKSAQGINLQASRLLKAMPKAWRQTLTLDNGSEFARFKDIETATGIKVFFADPYSAWQRGTNENTNGLIRQYFPKGCNFKAVAKTTLAKAVTAINHRPRKCLGFKTPNEVRREQLGAS
jgi:IS30 family transposase